MDMKKSRTKKLADAFGTLGYLSSALLWLWAALLLVPWLRTLGVVKRIIIEHPTPVQHVTAHSSYTLPEWLLYSIVALVFFMVLVAIMYVVKLPKKTARSVSSATHTVARRVATEIVHSPQPPKKQLFALTEAIVWWLKAVLVSVPVVIIIAAALLVPMPFEASVTTVVTIYLVSWPILWFVLQSIMTMIERKRSPKSTAF